MIKDFGRFTYEELEVLPGLIATFAIAEDGRPWQQIYSEFTDYEGHVFIRSKYRTYVTLQGDRVLMTSHDPSRLMPENGERILATDLNVTPESLYVEGEGFIEPEPR